MFKSSVSIMTVTLLFLSTTGCSGKQHLLKNGYETGMATKKSITETSATWYAPPSKEGRIKTNVEIDMATKSSISDPKDSARNECRDSNPYDDKKSESKDSKRYEKIEQRERKVDLDLCMQRKGFGSY